MVTNCIHPRPNQKTIRLGGTPVSTARLCESTGIHQSHISRVLNRKRDPSVTTAMTLAKALGITLEEFVGYLGFTYE